MVFLLIVTRVQSLSMCVSMRVPFWCGQLIACRLVWLMKHAAAEIDSGARWPRRAARVRGRPRLGEVKSSPGNKS